MRISEEELYGKNPNVFSSGNIRRVLETCVGNILAGKVWMGEIENKKKSGEPFCAITHLGLDNEEQIVGFLVYITM